MAQAVGNRILDRYEVVRAIKSGGMGAVYEARDLRLAGSACAVKEILEGVASGPDAEYVEDKFKAEVEALATLDHPGIPKVRDFFRVDKTLYIVMEFVAGKSLDDELAECQRVTGRPLEPEVVAGDTLQVLEILVYLHGRQMLHRDVKPSNLVRDNATGRVKLVDFGLARTFGDQQMMTMVGTPGYSAPEQLSGRAEPRSDLYALGVTMHHLLSGLTPRMLDLQPLKQHMPDYRPGLAAIIDKATRPKVSERYENAAAMLAALREWCRVEQARRAVGQPVTAREEEPPAASFVQAPPTVIAPPGLPAWLPGVVLGVLGLGLGLLLGARPPTSQAADVPRPRATVTPLAVTMTPPTVAPSPRGPVVRQPDYVAFRPDRRPAATPTPTPTPAPRPVRTTPVRAPARVTVVPAQPSYPTAHRKPRLTPTPTPVATLPPVHAPGPAEVPPVNLPPTRPPMSDPGLSVPVPTRTALIANLPAGIALEHNGMTAVIRPRPTLGGGRNARFGRPQFRLNVRCMDVNVPEQRALDEAVNRLAQVPGAFPLQGLPSNERGVQGPGPGGGHSLVLVKSKPEGAGTRLCVIEGFVGEDSFSVVKDIGRGVKLR